MNKPKIDGASEEKDNPTIADDATVQCVRHPAVADSATMLSVSRPTAGEVENCTGREAAFLAQQPAEQGHDLIHLSETCHGNFRAHEFNKLLRELLEQRRIECGGSDGIDEYTGGRQLLAERLCQSNHACLGGGIGRQVGIAFLSSDGRQIDYPTVPALDHVGCDGLAAVEDTIEVDIHDPLPVVH